MVAFSHPQRHDGNDRRLIDWLLGYARGPGSRTPFGQSNNRAAIFGFPFHFDRLVLLFVCWNRRHNFGSKAVKEQEEPAQPISNKGQTKGDDHQHRPPHGSTSNMPTMIKVKVPVWTITTTNNKQGVVASPPPKANNNEYSDVAVGSKQAQDDDSNDT